MRRIVLLVALPLALVILMAFAGCEEWTEDYAESTAQRQPTDLGLEHVREWPVGPVTVTLEPERLDMPRIVPAGRVLFEVRNDDDEVHGFAIEGTPVRLRLGPGEVESIHLDVAPGNYTVVCPLEGHAERGERAPLVVVPRERISRSLPPPPRRAPAPPREP